MGEWSDEKHDALSKELAELVRQTQREAESIGTLQGGSPPPLNTMFEDVFKEMPWHLRRQRQAMGV